MGNASFLTYELKIDGLVDFFVRQWVEGINVSNFGIDRACVDVCC